MRLFWIFESDYLVLNFSTMILSASQCYQVSKNFSRSSEFLKRFVFLSSDFFTYAITILKELFILIQ